MSRTYKDHPVWVKSNDRKVFPVAYHHHIDYRGNSVDCDVDEPTIQSDKWRWKKNCGYDRFYYGDSPSKAEVNNDWHAPIRTKVRRELRSEAKEYNTAGDFEVDYLAPLDQRHSPIKGIGWG